MPRAVKSSVFRESRREISAPDIGSQKSGWDRSASPLLVSNDNIFSSEKYIRVELDIHVSVIQ